MQPASLRRKLFLVIIHPAIWSIPIALLVIWLLPPVFQKYKLEEVSEIRVEEGVKYSYYDLNGDGISEEIRSGNQETNSFMRIMYLNGKSSQINTKGKYIELFDHLMVGDYDNDGKQEIYSFTVANDSVFIHQIHCTEDFNCEWIHSKYICSKVLFNGHKDLSMYSGKVTDLDGDGFKEVVFTLNGGFSIQPRGIFVYNVLRDSIYRTKPMGLFCDKAKFADLDHDGLDEIAVGNYAISNFDSKEDATVPFNDWYYYNMVLDNDLSFLFTPQRFEGDFAGIGYLIDEKNPELITGCTVEIDNQKFLHLVKYDLKGNILNKLHFTNQNKQEYKTFKLVHRKNKKGVILISTDKPSLEMYSTDFELIKKSKLPTGNISDWVFDIDMDGNDEIISRTQKLDQMVILRDDLSNPVYFSSEVGHEEIHFFNQMLTEKGDLQFVIQLGTIMKVMRYFENPFYLLKYPFFLTLYILFFVMFYYFRKIQRLQALKKYELQLRLSQLQLVNFRNQFEPHFMFNILNTISSVIIQGRKEDAYELVMKFSKTLRTILMSADKVSRSLQEEIDFTREYVTLQQFRFEKPFHFEVILNEKVRPEQAVPKMVIQTYVENAIKHGIITLKSNGKIRVEIKNETNNNLLISIIDNGIGREAASFKNLENTGKGLLNMKNFYEILNKNNKRKITETFTDLKDKNGKPTGTRVDLLIPKGMQFEINPRPTTHNP